MKRKFLLMVVCWFVASSVYAVQPPGFGSVQDNNDGEQGQILMNTGQDHGNSDVGTWVDSDSFKGEKGDTGSQGAKGTTGDAGKSGAKGETGKQGQRGERGYTGKGLKDRVNLMLGVEHEGEKWIKGVHGGYDVNNSVGIIEIRFTRKIGKSHTEKMIKYLQKQIDDIKVIQGGEVVDHFEDDDMDIIPTSNGFKIQKKGI